MPNRNKSIDTLINQTSTDVLQNDIDKLANGRKHSRALVYAPMRDTYLNILTEINPNKRKKQKRSSIAEISDEAHRYASMLEEHQTYGDILDANEQIFLDVFCKIDELRSCGLLVHRE